ncbi:hypothetical protein AX774_g5317 [Zancudomyces culisetae]|uniref:Uncharacterized protein n=1 Tax=Zancudomyces culisetae TaxID=1213189 RepID=A0A1R1PJT6_ZANCU|nr:hypothetical protein AX774_g5317 [Zancudomyces culisetae]|eukprot:OMH81231.1 hypothetical protein AX774_g5317 [Zancudomyces culisetae]
MLITRTTLLTITSFVYSTLGYYTNINTQVPNDGGCARYTSPNYVADAIDRLGILADIEYILAYQKTSYANDFKSNMRTYNDYFLKEVCTSTDGIVSTHAKEWYTNEFYNDRPVPTQGCEYPYFKNGVGYPAYARGKMGHFVEYRICELEFECSITASVINLDEGEERNSPVEDGCTFSVINPMLPSNLLSAFCLNTSTGYSHFQFC